MLWNPKRKWLKGHFWKYLLCSKQLQGTNSFVISLWWRQCDPRGLFVLLCYFGVWKCFNTVKQANKPIKRAAEQRGNGEVKVTKALSKVIKQIFLIKQEGFKLFNMKVWVCRDLYIMILDTCCSLTGVFVLHDAASQTFLMIYFQQFQKLFVSFGTKHIKHNQRWKLRQFYFLEANI